MAPESTTAPMSPEAALLQKQMQHSTFKRPGELAVVALLWLCGTISLITTVLIVTTLFGETIDFFREVSPAEFFLETRWQALIPGTESFGIWELVAGTANVVLWSMVFALPLGLAAAIYLSEYAHPRTRSNLKPLLEVLAASPPSSTRSSPSPSSPKTSSGRSSAMTACRFSTRSPPRS
jgi:phosphate transport system permease protein